MNHQHAARKQVWGGVEQANPSKEHVDYAELNFGVTTIEYASERSSFDFHGFRVVTWFSDENYEPIHRMTKRLDHTTASEIVSANGGWDYTE